MNEEDMLSAYADGQLDAEETRRVEAYLAANPAAQRTVQMHRETTGLLRSALGEGQFARAGDQGMVFRRRRFAVPGYGWAVAASILLAALGYIAGVAWPELLVSERSNMLTEIAEYHSVYSRETVHLVEVPATQTEHLKAWLGKRVDRELVIPDFKASGLTFAGGRMVVLDGMPVAELMYTREKGLPIAFCIVRGGGAQDAIEVSRRGDVQLASWDDGSHSYVVVGEASADLIRELASMARKQL